MLDATKSLVKEILDEDFGLINTINEELVCEQATGCSSAGAFRRAFANMGYNFCTVTDWCSSAGDWNFIVSEDGYEWHLASQINNWPKGGFSYSVSEDEVYYGSSDEVLEELAERFMY